MIMFILEFLVSYCHFEFCLIVFRLGKVGSVSGWWKLNEKAFLKLVVLCLVTYDSTNVYMRYIFTSQLSLSSFKHDRNTLYRELVPIIMHFVHTVAWVLKIWIVIKKKNSPSGIYVLGLLKLSMWNCKMNVFF